VFFYTAGGLQQTQPTMPQQSYPAAYPGLYQAIYCTVNRNNYITMYAKVKFDWF